MEFSLQSVHPDIFDRVALYLPLSSRLQLAATCRSIRSRVVFRDGRSQLENLPPSVLNKTMLCMSSHADRLRLGAASWTLRKWAIQNGLLTLHCYRIQLQEDCFEFLDEYEEEIGVLPFQDGDLPIRVAAGTFVLRTDFSRAHIDQSIRRLSAFRPPLRPDRIHLLDSDTLSGRSDDPTAVRRLIEYLGGTSRSLNKLCCLTKPDETLLLESDFLHHVQVHRITFTVGDIGPDGLDFAVEDSVQEGAQSREYPYVHIQLSNRGRFSSTRSILAKFGKRESSMSSAPIVFDSLLRFMRVHFSPNPDVRFKYNVTFTCWGDNSSSVIRTLAKEYGVQPETSCDSEKKTLRFKTPSDPTRLIVLIRQLKDARHDIFVGAGQEPWWWPIV